MSHRSRVGLAALVLAAAFVFLSACGGSGATAIGGGMLSKRQPAPKLAGGTLDGGQLDVASLRGQVVVVNFYAQWCAPCRAEAGALRNAYAETKDSGVTFVGVLFQDSIVNGRAYLKDADLTYRSLNDSDGVLLTKFKNVNARTIPDTFVLDRQGKVAARWIGPIKDETAFTQVLRSLAAEPA